MKLADRDAEFTAFMAQAGPSLLRTAWLLTGDGHEAQELTQAALVKTYASWKRVDSGRALAYARRILVNQRTDSWRSTRKEISIADPPEPAATAASGDRDGATGVAQRDEIVRLLKTLPPQQRTVIVLRYYTDLSEKETADTLGISVGAVKSAASRGLAALREAMPTNDIQTSSRTEGRA